MMVVNHDNYMVSRMGSRACRMVSSSYRPMYLEPSATGIPFVAAVDHTLLLSYAQLARAKPYNVPYCVPFHTCTW